MKKLKIFTLIFALLLCLSALPVPAAAVSQPSVAAPNVLVLDRLSGSVLYEKNADAKVWPASTTKIMTVLLAVEAVERGEIDPDAEITTPAAALEGLSELGSTAGIRAGEILTLRQLMYCAMISSANEAGNVIAFALAGGIAPFAERMTARAQELGCTGTHFANTHGLPNLDHYTTVSDMGRIAMEAMRHPLFVEICSTADIELPATNLSGARSLHNSNALISSASLYGSGYLYDGASGVKTGHTTAAGYCLVSAAQRSGVDLLVLVYGDATSDGCFRDTITLYDWAFKNYSYREIASSSECVGTVPVRDGDLLDYVDLCPAEDFLLLLPNDCDLDEFTQQVTVYGLEEGATLTGPITPGTVLGRLELLKNGEDFGGVDLIPASSSALIMDRRTGEVLYGKGMDNRVYPADTTKLMTALLAVEAVERGDVSMNDMVTVTEAKDIDTDANSGSCGLQVGEQITLGALLDCVVLASADDAANAVAEYVGGSVPAFVGMMNARAEELGCADTVFTNVHGAYSDGHYTTARDFCRIALEASRHEKLMRICGSVVSELDATNLSPARTLKNTNALLCDESVYGAAYLYEGASGMKTGYNPGAGYALVSTASKNGIDLLCAIFGGTKDESGYTCFSDTITLFDWVFDNYAYEEVIKSTENIASVDIALGKDADYVNIRPATSITVLLPKDYDPAEFEKEIRVYALENGETVTAPVTAGQVLGEVTLTRGSRSYGTVKLVASASVELSRIQYIRQQISETTQQRSFRLTVAILAGLFALYLIWVLAYRIRHIRHVRAVRAAERARLLQTEMAMKAAENPKEPGIRFFAEDGPAEQPKPAPKNEPKPAQADDRVIQLFPQKQHDAPEQPAAAPEQPAAAPADLLAEALLVAELEPEREETPEEKAERDYFAEFFRPKQ